MPFISITRLRLRSWRYLPIFMLQSLRSARQARRASGNLGVSVLREEGNVFWTRTLWESQQAMKAFMLSGVHGRVMRKLLEWCDEAAVVNWTSASPDAPPWHEAHQALMQHGRLSKVNHPSEAQQSFQFPEPRIPPGRETRWK